MVASRRAVLAPLIALAGCSWTTPTGAPRLAPADLRPPREAASEAPWPEGPPIDPRFRAALAAYAGAVAELAIDGSGPAAMRLRLAMCELAAAIERLPPALGGDPPELAAELIRGAEAHLALRLPVEARVLQETRRALGAASAAVLEVAIARFPRAPGVIASARRFARASRVIGEPEGPYSPRAAILEALEAGHDALRAMYEARARGEDP